MRDGSQIGETLAAVCRQFRLPGELTGYRLLPGGHINMTCSAALSNGRETRTYLVQRVNRYVFQDPVGLMRNIDRITGHILDKESAAEGPGTLRYYRTAAGDNYAILGRGEGAELWRVCDYIENAVSFEAGEGDDRVLRGAGKGFGRFLRQLRDFDPSRLAETIPHFHDTPYRMKAFFQSVTEDPLGRAKGAQREIERIRTAGGFAGALRDRLDRGGLPVRVTHNDAKTSNILFDQDTLEPLAVIDLDTCMPGLVCYDFGDLIRFAACRAEENAGYRLDLSRFRACAQGYLSETADFLTRAELDSLAAGAAAVTLELASRFLGDYLMGDRYFQINYPAHNLDRARRQLELYQDMMLRMEDMEEILQEVILCNSNQ